MSGRGSRRRALPLPPGAAAPPSSQPARESSSDSKSVPGTPAVAPARRVPSTIETTRTRSRISNSAASSVSEAAVSTTPRFSLDNSSSPLSPTTPSSVFGDSSEKGDDSQNVIVCVRVRPFNQRERDLKQQSVVVMENNTTTVTHPVKGTTKTFIYDHSFSSHDPNDPNFVTQETVFQKIGHPLLERSLQGYNVTAFAYGQTGSGKSYSMMGPPGSSDSFASDKGLIPRFADELFSRGDDLAKSKNISLKVEISYFEIYSERIYDLLAPTTKNGRVQQLRVREHPILGPYVDGLTQYAALDYNDIEGWLTVGGKHRATAATNMNATSSRSHAVFVMSVTQTMLDEDNIEHTKVSKVNLVDLAGSERSDAAGTTGVRLREGSAINKSLHTLGKVISLLADKALKKRNIFIPYRDSVLTWILKESLGGNSKTAMLATVSPALVNFDETLSTLRYAQQARKIVNDATINEDPNAKLVRELRAEIDRLRMQFGDGRNNMAEVSTLRDKLSQTQALMTAMNRSWEEKLRLAEKMRKEQGIEQATTKINNKLPNLVNLNEDPQLSEMLIYMLEEGQSMVGSKEGADVQLAGALVLPEHCTLSCDKSEAADGYDVTITVFNEAQVFINGHEAETDKTVALNHGDRIVIGNHHYFRLNIPRQRSKAASTSQPREEKNFQFAQNELEHVQAERIRQQIEEETSKVKEDLSKQHTEERERMLQTLEQAQEALQQKELEHSQILERLEADRMREIEQKEAEVRRLNEMAASAQEQSRLEATEEAEKLKSEIQKQLEIKHEKEKRQLQQAAQEKERIINDLRTQKEKVQMEFKNLQSDNEKYKATRSNIHILAPSVDFGPNVDPYEILAVTSTLKEANKMAKDMNQGTVFTLVTNKGPPIIKVTNTEMKLHTFWPLDKYGDRLEQIREAYNNRDTGDDSSGDLASLFFDADDTWQKEEGDHAGGSLNGSSNSDLRKVLDSIKYGESHPEAASEVALRRRSSMRYIKNIMQVLQSKNSGRTLVEEVVGCISTLKMAVSSLNTAHEQADEEVPLKELGVVRNASVSAVLSIELLSAMIRRLMTSYDTKVLLDLAERMAQSTAILSSHVMKLMSGIENGFDDMVRVGYSDFLSSIQAVSRLSGELAIATDKSDDSEEFDQSEEQATPFAVARMVKLPESLSRRSSQYLDDLLPNGNDNNLVDDDVLQDFQLGARLHVEQSMDECKKELDLRADDILLLIQQLTDISNVNDTILQAVAHVITTTKSMLSAATRCQVSLTNSMSSTLDENVQDSFYRKQYRQAKGIIAQVQLVVDAVSWLCNSCAMAVSGSDDVEHVSSRSANIKSCVAQLLTEAKLKMALIPSSSLALEKLEESGNSVYKVSHIVEKECRSFSQTEQGRRQRSISLSRSSSVKGRSFSTTKTSSIGTPNGHGSDGMSAVQRRSAIVDQRALILRLENELNDARRALSTMNQSEYDSSTTAI